MDIDMDMYMEIDIDTNQYIVRHKHMDPTGPHECYV
jgi:hypothetical protein